RAYTVPRAPLVTTWTDRFGMVTGSYDAVTAQVTVHLAPDRCRRSGSCQDERERAARVKAAPAPSAARGALDTRKRSPKMSAPERRKLHCDVVLALRFRILRQRIARVNATLASARRFAALTRAIRSRITRHLSKRSASSMSPDRSRTVF